MNRRAAGLVMFCRRPRRGAGKQRLARSIGTEAACAIAEALLACALEDARHWPGDLILSPADPGDDDWAAGLVAGRTVLVRPQCAGNLGERLGAVDARLRAEGYAELVFVGTDAPSLCLADLLAAHVALRRADAVFAPAADGGVVAMGSRRAWPPLADLPWSEARLGTALARRCRDHGLSTARVRASYDVDVPGDLATLRRALADDPRPARQRLLACVTAVAPGPQATVVPVAAVARESRR